MSDTPFEAQRRKLHELKGKQDVGGEAAITSTAQARRDEESEEPSTSKKKSKNKTSG